MNTEQVAARSYLDIETPEDRTERHKRVAERADMVILTFHYLNDVSDLRWWDSQPMPVEAAMDRVMRFVQSGADVIQHNDTGRMDVLLIHRVTGITIVPVG